MQDDGFAQWRQAERAAEQAEKAARAAVAARAPDCRELAATARGLRKHSDALWRECLGSSLAPLAPTTPSTITPTTPSIGAGAQATDPAALNVPIEAWRRAQARAHAAEVKAVQAFTRYAEGAEEMPPLSSKAEAALLRQTSAERLDRVYQVARLLRGPSSSH